MKTYRIIIEMATPYNPDKWDWTELIASEPDETIISLQCDEINAVFRPDADDSTEGTWEVLA